MLYYKSFSNQDLIYEAKPYQYDAYFNCPRSLLYDKDEYKFTLIPCIKFPQSYIIKRDDGSLSGLLTYDHSIELFSTEDKIATASIGTEDNSQTQKTAIKNCCVEYRGGVVEIIKDDIVWLDNNNKILI